MIGTSTAAMMRHMYLMIVVTCGRWIEYVNKIMKSRNSSFNAFESASIFTENVKACVHVDTEYSEACGEGLDTPMDAR